MLNVGYITPKVTIAYSLRIPSIIIYNESSDDGDSTESLSQTVRLHRNMWIHVTYPYEVLRTFICVELLQKAAS